MKIVFSEIHNLINVLCYQANKIIRSMIGLSSEIIIE